MQDVTQAYRSFIHIHAKMFHMMKACYPSADESQNVQISIVYITWTFSVLPSHYM